MLLRRLAVTLALAAVACEPGVATVSNPSSVDYGVFEPTGDPAHGSGALIPLPNDLALQPAAIATQNPTQQALLNAFRAQGGFPNDQEVPLTIDFVRYNLDASSGAYTRSAPPIDVSSIKPQTLLVLALSGQGTGTPVAYDAPKAADYVTVTEPGGGTHGELTLHKSKNASGSRRFDPGNYAFAVRGGANGVKTTDGKTLNPEPAMFLLLQDSSLVNNPDALALIPGNSIEEKQTAALQLEAIRVSLVDPFKAYDAAGFPHREIATVGKFAIASMPAHVETDPSGGLMPFPSDFLLAPDATQGGALRPSPDFLATPALAPLASGLKTLDGFSTTAMVLMETSGNIQASTVNASTVFLIELGNAAAITADPRAVSPRVMTELVAAAMAGHPENAEYVAEPSPIVVSGLSTVIGLQPAVPAQLPAQLGGAFVTLPPLKEGTLYGVVVTNGVKDVNNVALGRSTLSGLLLGSKPLVVSGKSQVAGVSDAQAAALEQARQLNAAVLVPTVGAAAGVTADKVIMAYTFRTQTFKGVAPQLAGIPYLPSTAPNYNPLNDNSLKPVGTPKLYCNAALTGASYPNCEADPGTSTHGSLDTVFDKYGVDTSIIPVGNIGFVMDAVMVTVNNLSSANGAFNPDPVHQATAEPIPVLIAMPPCAAAIAGTGTCTVPLVVFRHGLGSSRAAMFAVANELVGQGYAVAAIDAAKHGARAYCNPARNGTSTAECVPGATCVADPALTGQGDPSGQSPGHCSGGPFLNKPLSCNLPTDSATCAAFFAANAGTPFASGEYLISGNLFRSRDTFRQDIIDESALIRVLSPDPASDAGNFFFTQWTGNFVKHDGIYYMGQSLGSIQGMLSLAANPRIAAADLSVGGGTVVDTFSQSPNLSPSLNALLTGLGIAPGSAAYLQFLLVSKWVLDPAEPVNYSKNITDAANTLPNPLTQQPHMAAKRVLAQNASCDQTVPNAFEWNLAGDIGLTPVPADFTCLGGGACNTNATHQLYVRPALAPTTDQQKSPGCTASLGVVNHSFLTDWKTYGTSSSSITKIAQDDAVTFFGGGSVVSTHAAP